MRVLGIESSCDETGVAIYDTEQGLLGQALYSQVEMHARYGGVVPELLARAIHEPLSMIPEPPAIAELDPARERERALAPALPAARRARSPCWSQCAGE